jgi:tellurite resistance protein TehA-like permease
MLPPARLLDAVGPASGGIVMGTGIVSVALGLDGRQTLSHALLTIAATAWVALAVLVPIRARRDGARFRRDIATPAAFTAVAGTAVLGTGLTAVGWAWAGSASLIALAAAGLDSPPGAARLLRDAALGLWLLSLLWLPVLLGAEVRWPRPGYDVRRWATVFPVGMYAACSFEVGAIASAPTITWFARVWVWAALALWVVVACGLAEAAAAPRASAR